MKIVTICYNQKIEWNSKEDALKEFWNCAICSEGAERDRYISIIEQLNEGKTLCVDEYE